MKEIVSKILGRRGRFSTTGEAEVCTECGSKLSAPEGWREREREPQAGVSDGSRGRSPHQAEGMVCPNPDCPAQVRRALLHWCSPEVMDVAGADERLITLLVKHGLARDVAELYRLKVKELAALPGFDQVAAQQLFDAITTSMKRDAWRLLFGLGIPLVGAGEARALSAGFPSVDAVFAAGVPRLMQEGGVNQAVAESIVRWHSDSVNRRLVKRLEKLGVNFKSEPGRGGPSTH